ncbi:hypothetical protein AKJ09_02975 [Labilithrix luteola]|uniref:Glycosyltransferase RgtA/B/C/D-like domain-containing protein n=1 Tax=Labilithrix luteola TaxID=1391654 RepID=A0A0K1PSH4_9BACT|nr:hypothetical protein [Labilithrix luteola]AKU96311.1 hypothetical protein AKJ09_02975 [Labilithrix luteola]
MALLFAFSLLALVASLAVTSAVTGNAFRSRSETVIAASLVWNALIVAPIYMLGLMGLLTRPALGIASVVLSLGLLAMHLRSESRPLGDGTHALAGIGKRAGQLALLPFEGLMKTWERRSLATIGALAALLLFPWMALSAYLAPAWRDWDALWYHEPLTGFTIQNHGFAPVPLPSGLQVVNGVQRLCEMTQTWFAIWGGRRLIDLTNVAFMPLLAASMFALARRYTKDVVTGVAWASALVLFPGFVRMLQSTMVDPQACALLLAAAYFVTHPKLDRTNATYAILGLTLAVGAKIWSIVPVGLLSLVLLFRLLARRKENGGLASIVLVLVGTVCLIGMQAITYLRNWLNFQNPLWPIITYNNDALGIHWKGNIVTVDAGASRLNIDFNEPFLVFYKKMLAAPFTAMSPGHTWQLNDYGFGYAWVVFPVAAVAILLVTARWLSRTSARVFKLGGASTPDEATSSAMVLAVVGGASLYLSPALHIPRYHVAAVGMLCAVICWLSGRQTGSRLAMGVAIVAQLSSICTLHWAPKKAPFVSVYAPEHVLHWLKTPYPQREVQDVGTHEIPRMMISPVNPETGLAREREVKAGDVVGFDNIDFASLLWNNAYSNKVVWLSSNDPLGEANRIGAVWVYTRPGTALANQLGRPGSGWELVGPLEAEGFGNVWRRKR